MAKLNRKYDDNVDGSFYVDKACIDCDLCRQTAPNFFKRSAIGNTGHSVVFRQPVKAADIRVCEDALDACPVSAIGRCNFSVDETEAESVYATSNSGGVLV